MKQKITFENYEEIYKYFEKRVEPINYWCDSAWLLNRSQHYFKIDEDVLLVFKSFPYNPEKWQIILPPMTLDNDYEKELMFIQKYNKEYSFVLSDYDVDNYNISFTKLDQKKQQQYIYGTSEYDNLIGKKWKYFRHALNKSEKYGYSFHFTEHDPDDPFTPIASVLGKINEVENRWADEQIQERKETDSYSNLWTKRVAGLRNYHIMTIEKDSFTPPDSPVVGYTLSQKIGNTAVIACGKTLHSEFGNLPIEKAMICQNAYYFQKLGCKYMNQGGGSGASAEMKKVLRPIYVMDLYKLKYGRL